MYTTTGTYNSLFQSNQHNRQSSNLYTLYLCVLYSCGEQTVTCATYILHRLVFITDKKSVYCAVRTGSLNKAACASSLKG